MKPLVTGLERIGVKRLLVAGRDVAKLSVGALARLFGKATPGFAHQAMIGLYCSTSGYSNDLFSGLIRLLRPRYDLPDCQGVLGRMDDARLREVIGDLNTSGYHVFTERLPPELCDRLMRFALNTTCSVRAMDTAAAPAEPVFYDAGNPVGVRYDFREEDLIHDPDVQQLMSDLSIIKVAQEYLGSLPILDIVAMWWHTAFSKNADKSAAQFYHFDMDRLKWLKFFFYLTEVSPDTGPHAFVAGSHRRGKTPRALLKQGYRRLTDSEVREHFEPDDFIEFTGPRGTIIAEDTRGLHKGKHVRHGHRLMFELEFTNSLFGGALPDDRLREVASEELATRIEQYPGVYELFTPVGQRR
jgi:hypothetical protein